MIVGHLAGEEDIRNYGDHNPGAANVLRAAGWGWGALAMMLDFLKGALPVGMAWFLFGMNGWEIVPVAMAPVLGHAYSPWMRFHGGKAVATTFGIWSGLTIGAIPTLFGLTLGVTFLTFTSSGWAVISSMLSIGVFIAWYYGGVFPEFVWIWALNLILLIARHVPELNKPPGLRYRLFRDR